jgi:hypothetical protein
MSSEFPSRKSADDLTQFEQTLASLTPVPPQVDRDRLMFLAGAASAGEETQKTGGRGQMGPVVTAGRSAWLWPAATAALGATSLALAIALVARSAAPTQIVYVERPAPAVSPRVAIQSNQTRENPAAAPMAAEVNQRVPRTLAVPQVPADNYVRSRDVALLLGLDALGTPRSAGGGSAAGMTYFDWLVGLDPSASPADQPPGNPSLDSALPKM